MKTGYSSDLIDIVGKSMLFRNLDEDQIQHLLNFIGFSEKTYSREESIVLEDDVCDSLGIVLKGRIELQTIFPNGNVITHMDLEKSDVFGEALLFSKFNKYPVHIQSITQSKVLFIKKDKLMHGLLHHPILLQNFLTLLSTKLFVMNNKVKILSLDTIRKKVAYFLIEQYKIQKSLKIKCSLSRKQMAEHLAVQRPSLSRELIKMKEDGLIEFDEKDFVITDLEDLEAELF